MLGVVREDLGVLDLERLTRADEGRVGAEFVRLVEVGTHDRDVRIAGVAIILCIGQVEISRHDFSVLVGDAGPSVTTVVRQYVACVRRAAAVEDDVVGRIVQNSGRTVSVQVGD